MLDAYIIEEIKKEESRKREAEERPRLHIEMPQPPWPKRDEEDTEDDEVEDTVIHIEMTPLRGPSST